MLKTIGSFFVGVFKFLRRIAFILILFFIAVFILTIFLPENVNLAIEIFKNILKIP